MGRKWQHVWLLGLMPCALGLLRPSGVDGQHAARITLVFHVAQRDEHPVASEEFLETQLSSAQSMFGPLGIALVRGESKTLPASHAELVSRADRDVLGAFNEPDVVNCFVVASLMDVDEPGRVRRGVHWTVRSDPKKHFVVVSAISGPFVLAHELGHFFGNRAHSDTPGNLMSYETTDAPPFLDDAQKRRVRRTVSDMIARRELRPTSKARRSHRRQPAPHGRGDRARAHDG